MLEAEDTFESPPIANAEGQFVLNLTGFEGPIDVLLALAREQKLDLSQISILELADQYLDFIVHARKQHLEIAADYLVMAAWLAYLKSKLLLPEPEEDEDGPSAAEMAEALAFQLRRLEAMQEASQRLFALPQLGRDVFNRGNPEGITIIGKSVYVLSLYDLLRSYGEIQGRAELGMLHIEPTNLFTMEEGLKRLSAMLGGTPDWQTLRSYLPAVPEGGLRRRSAIASTFSASLELVRTGKAELRQEQNFGPLYIRARDAE
ncbi:MAG: segregation/condensation protein A [Alphaproteobacteria bacterium]|nr:segregation/condensation protein A [Alphaproteobacteria bacterium]